MQQLHLVGVTTDHDSLIFSVRKGAKSGSFVLPLDENLLAAVADAVRRMHATGGEVELPIELDTASAPQRRQSNLSPREIQDRLRGGRTLEEVATEAGVGEEWVARFAAPVEAERNQIVTRSRELVYAKARLGNSREPLGLSVRWNLADRGVRMTDDDFDAAWSGYLLNDATWMVTFSFTSRKREQLAEWEVDLDSDTLTSRNRLASDLGYVEPGRRRRSLTSLQPPAAARGARSATNSNASQATPGASGPATKPIAVAAASGSGAKAGPAEAPAAMRPRKSAAQRKAPAANASARSSAPAAKNAGTKRVGPRKASAKKAPKAADVKVPAKNAAKKVAKKAAKKAPAKKAPAKKAPAKKAPAKKAPAKKAPAKKANGERSVPAVAKPRPNELGLRRLQMIGGENGGSQPRPGSHPGGGYAARAAATSPPRPRQDWPPQAPPSTPAAPAQRHTSDTAGPDVEVASGSPSSARIFDVGDDSGLDVMSAERVSSRPDARADAEARRLERRRVRAAAREPVGSRTDRSGRAPAPRSDAADLEDGDTSDDIEGWQAFAAMPAGRGGRGSSARAGVADEADGDGRVVTIRANRTMPPTNEGEVILPPDRPPLRPAQPAAQPKRRRFGRNDR